MTENPPPLYCANHPTVETSLRCKTCDKPICAKCAVLTPTGYRCRECVRSQQKVFDTANWFDYPVVIAIAGVFSFAGSLLVSAMGFFTIFVAPIAGMLIAEAIRLAIRRRRSERLFQVAAGSAAIGSLPLLAMLGLGALGGMRLGGLLALLWQGVYAFTITTTVYYRLRGIQVK